MNPKSKYYLAFNLGFPNAYDRSHGRTGADIMVHGDCKSAGCYAMTDAVVEEIYILAREALAGGQELFQVQAYPFRMTKANMAKHKRRQVVWLLAEPERRLRLFRGDASAAEGRCLR